MLDYSTGTQYKMIVIIQLNTIRFIWIILFSYLDYGKIIQINRYPIFLLCKFKDFPAEYKMFTSHLQRGL
jgi:hypothetical protein